MSSATRKPQNFAEQYRFQNYRFKLYRDTGNPPDSSSREAARIRTKWMELPFPRQGKPPDNSTREAARIRTKWMKFKFPRQGKPKIRPGSKMEQLPYHPQPQGPNLVGPTPKHGKREFRETRDRFRKAKRWFLKRPQFSFIRPLGYGALGLAIQFKHLSSEAGVPSRDIVLKVATEGWEDDLIRLENKATKRMARAAHCIQRIDPQSVGMEPTKPYAFEEPRLWDSSAEEDSSGDESVADERPPEPKTRRWLWDNERETIDKRSRDYTTRFDATMKRINDRDDRLYERDERRAKGLPDKEDDAEWDLDHKDYLLLEFVENGDLTRLICKLNDMKENIPNRVLWSFWLCLVRACVAMEYPPRKFHPRRRENPNDITAQMGALRIEDDVAGKVVNGDLFEDIPVARRRWAGKRIVHFDIDPSNIFIAGFDLGAADNEHKLIPRLKLADFGLTDKIKPNKSNRYYYERRDIGKDGYAAPEQFGVDWEHLEVTDTWGPELSESTTMWQLITKLKVPSAPQPQEKAGEPVSYCVLLLTDDRFKDVDIELREELSRCMRHNPADRPTLIQLLQRAKTGAGKVFANEPDETVKAWVQRAIYGAPAQ
ncbi:kinase-like protein [Whalleya microplaca]|nr:kinase-like protein [Whalleya microplaca]